MQGNFLAQGLLNLQQFCINTKATHSAMISEMQTSSKTIDNLLESLKNEATQMNSRMLALEAKNTTPQNTEKTCDETAKFNEIRESLTEIQCDNRMNNLLFFGIDEIDSENTEAIMKDFCINI